MLKSLSGNNLRKTMAMDTLLTAEMGDWIWQRHQNLLSWYIRPLFLLPLAWFAYRRSVPGLVGTLLALVTSMCWFPAPSVPDPRVEEFLAFEQAWLTGRWDAAKVLPTLLGSAGAQRHGRRQAGVGCGGR
jgi:hypothetical protein